MCRVCPRPQQQSGDAEAERLRQWLTQGVRMTSMKPLPALAREQVWAGPCGLSPSGICQGWNRYLLESLPATELVQLIIPPRKPRDPHQEILLCSLPPHSYPGPGILSCHCDPPHPDSSWRSPIPAPDPSPVLGDNLCLFLMAQATGRCCSWCCPKAPSTKQLPQIPPS